MIYGILIAQDQANAKAKKLLSQALSSGKASP
jgi:hypothetical protein